MVRDVVTPLADTRSTFADEEVSDVIVSEPVQTKPRRLRHIAEGVLAALIIAGLVASWLVIQQRLHPSQGAASTPLLAISWSRGLVLPCGRQIANTSVSLPILLLAGETVLVWNRATGQVTKHMLHSLLANPQQNTNRICTRRQAPCLCGIKCKQQGGSTSLGRHCLAQYPYHLFIFTFWLSRCTVVTRQHAFRHSP